MPNNPSCKTALVLRWVIGLTGIIYALGGGPLPDVPIPLPHVSIVWHRPFGPVGPPIPPVPSAPFPAKAFTILIEKPNDPNLINKDQLAALASPTLKAWAKAHNVRLRTWEVGIDPTNTDEDNDLKAAYAAFKALSNPPLPIMLVADGKGHGFIAPLTTEQDMLVQLQAIGGQ